MAKTERNVFKYILSPENTYIIDYGDVAYEVKGSRIMEIIRKESQLDDLVPSENLLED